MANNQSLLIRMRDCVLSFVVFMTAIVLATVLIVLASLGIIYMLRYTCA